MSSRGTCRWSALARQCLTKWQLIKRGTVAGWRKSSLGLLGYGRLTAEAASNSMKWSGWICDMQSRGPPGLTLKFSCAHLAQWSWARGLTSLAPQLYLPISTAVIPAGLTLPNSVNSPNHLEILRVVNEC